MMEIILDYIVFVSSVFILMRKSDAYALIFIYFFQQLSKYILMKDQPDCLEDALKVLKPEGNSLKIDLYMFRLRYLMLHDRVSRYFSKLVK